MRAVLSQQLSVEAATDTLDYEMAANAIDLQIGRDRIITSSGCRPNRLPDRCATLAHQRFRADNPSMLYVVGTPIGNLDDITYRALETLRNVDLIVAEDTRHSGNLLRHFEIRKPLLSYHEHNEAKRTAELIERIAAGETMALITDAGMPGVSDPGMRLVRKCIERNLPFTIVPGVSAVTTALVGSGFGMENFCYRGFLPVKSGQRERELRAAAERLETTVFFESPYRINKTLQACGVLMPSRLLCVARELTKKFEEFRRGIAAELLAHYTAHSPKGEITFLVEGRAPR